MRLVVLSENFGLNFSGGCIATARFLETLENAFDEVIILTQKIGDHHLKRAQFIVYKKPDEITALLAKQKLPNTIGYGDFHIAEHFIKPCIPFYFTYHDNFPAIGKLNLFSKAFVNKRMQCYKDIFENARHIFSVSKAKLLYIKKYTNKFSLIRNGVFQKVEKNKITVPATNKKTSVLMAGNIDMRKYQKALDLFNSLNEVQNLNLRIVIYGLVNNKELANALNTFSFVELKGYEKNIPFNNFHLYLNTSLAENLSIAVVDAIANYTPVITFDVGGLSEIVNKNNGFIIPRFKVEDMASELLNVNFNHFEKHFDKSTINNFNWEVGAKKMLKVMLG